MANIKVSTKERVYAWKKSFLKEESADLPWQDRSRRHSLLLEHHEAFQLEEGERSENDCVQM